MSTFIYFPATGEMASVNYSWSTIFNYIMYMVSMEIEHCCYLNASRIFFNGVAMKWDDLPEEIKAAFTLVI